MNLSSLEHLRNDFLQEAINAPKLFKDLAKVEQYIAESYKTRALIELIQNADDAHSTTFGLHNFEDGFLVGNNGIEFTIEDLEALCRSGSSNKRRGRNTIGYRGIGFKSVVNLAKQIFVFSGGFNFYFDKSDTQQTLHSDSDVPLIRVPHLVDEHHELLKSEVNELMKKFNYTTVFIFKNILEEISLKELSEFDKSSLLFLNNLREVQINFQNISRTISLKYINPNKGVTISITEGENKDEWEVVRSESNKIDSVAFKKENNIIIPALPKESVIHSFTPTFEPSGAFIKINGDFTTDPSRKIVDLDELSKSSFDNATNIISTSISAILNGDQTRTGFFTPFVNIQLNETSRFKTILFKGLENKLSGFSNIRLKPEWLNYEDYEEICQNNIKAIQKQLITVYPELFTFLESINFKTLSIEDIIQSFNQSKITITGSAEILSKIIKQNRYDLDSIKIDLFKSLNLFPVKGNFVQAKQVKNFKEIDTDFINHLFSIADSTDVAFFLKKLDIKQELAINDSITTEVLSINPHVQKQQTGINRGFKSEPAIKKWRSAEQNAAEYLKSLNAVLSVKDVTQANLGYDLEVLLTTGKRIYIEIKSVASFSEPFKISNNEYSSAHSYGLDYYIALVVNEDQFMMKLISDPIKTLSFEKKCERWSWFCEQYLNDLQDIENIFS